MSAVAECGCQVSLTWRETRDVCRSNRGRQTHAQIFNPDGLYLGHHGNFCGHSHPALGCRAEEKIARSVGWVELFAKPIMCPSKELVGFAKNSTHSTHPTKSLRGLCVVRHRRARAHEVAVAI